MIRSIWREVNSLVPFRSDSSPMTFSTLGSRKAKTAIARLVVLADIDSPFQLTELYRPETLESMKLIV
jgi:hypothetical protein